MTIESFAPLVHVHSRQIARYESEDYQNVSRDTSKVGWNSVARWLERPLSVTFLYPAMQKVASRSSILADGSYADAASASFGSSEPPPG